MLKTKACIGNERIRHAQAVPRSLLPQNNVRSLLRRKRNFRQMKQI